MSENRTGYDEENTVDHWTRSGKSCKDVSESFGISQPALRRWRKKYISNPDDPLRTVQRERIEALEKEDNVPYFSQKLMRTRSVTQMRLSLASIRSTASCSGKLWNSRF